MSLACSCGAAFLPPEGDGLLECPACGRPPVIEGAEGDEPVLLVEGRVLPQRVWEAEIRVRAAAWIAACQAILWVSAGLSCFMVVVTLEGTPSDVGVLGFACACETLAMGACSAGILHRGPRARWTLVFLELGLLTCLGVSTPYAPIPAPAVLTLGMVIHVGLGVFVVFSLCGDRAAKVFHPRVQDQPLAPLALPRGCHGRFLGPAMVRLVVVVTVAWTLIQSALILFVFPPR